jgi:hypothetical protein
MTEQQQVQDHAHTGTDSRRIDPKYFLPLPIFSTVPSVSNSPNQFIYINGGTKRLYVKHGTTLSYTALT